MFSETCVNHSLYRRGGLHMISLPVWLPGPMKHVQGGLCKRDLVKGGSL